jgi:hypothetical protein
MLLLDFKADEEEIFNPDCATRVLFESIRRKCNCVDKDTICFMDDKGGLVAVQDDKSMENAAKFFTHRGTYTLLCVDKKNDTTYNYIPLVNDPSKELLAKVESLSVGNVKNVKGYSRRNSKTPQANVKVSNQPSGKGRRK